MPETDGTRRMSSPAGGNMRHSVSQFRLTCIQDGDRGYRLNKSYEGMHIAVEHDDQPHPTWANMQDMEGRSGVDQ